MRLLTLEAMKMETVVESPLGGTVRAVNVRPSSQVAAGEVMIEIDEGGERGSTRREPRRSNSPRDRSRGSIRCAWWKRGCSGST